MHCYVMPTICQPHVVTRLAPKVFLSRVWSPLGPSSAKVQVTIVRARSMKPGHQIVRFQDRYPPSDTNRWFPMQLNDSRDGLHAPPLS